jgi:hypothetical protein
MKTTAEIPNAGSTPLWLGDQLIGHVSVESYELGTITGFLRLESAFEEKRPLFKNAVAAERAVAEASSHDYQAARRAWKQACQELQRLELSFGNLRVPIEGFTIDAEWRVEFESALWWDIMLSPNHGAAKSASRWR